MRSLGFTIFLALLAALACSFAGWQSRGNNLQGLLGAPPTPVGDLIYSNFKPEDVKSMRITTNGVVATFVLGEHGWQGTMPWKDRMDPVAAAAIIKFTLGLRVEDYTSATDVNAQKAGLRDSAVEIKLDDKDHHQIVRYKLGRQTPWLATIKDIDEPVPTVFILPRDENHKRFMYSCTGDIGSLFKDNLRYLRDHHPFFFNPLGLQKIRIQSSEGELTLSRETPNSPWRVVKPLDLATDIGSMKSLLQGLVQLQALKVSDRAAIAPPASSPLTKSRQISIASFGSPDETLLEIYPPESADSTVARATVSDRPDTVFDLPLKPEADVVSLAALPLSINDLREKVLTNLNIKSIRGVLIEPASDPEIVISRTPPAPWMATIEGKTEEANEERLFNLLKAVTEGRAIGFETDAATDFTPWGLDRPFLKLRFVAENDQFLELAFGTNGKGAYFVNRTGTPTVMRVDPGLISSLPVKSYEWRSARIWSIDRTNLQAIERSLAGQAPIQMLYDDANLAWTATQDSKDITADFDQQHANYMLENLEGLKVTRWLSSEDESADDALMRPSLGFKILENKLDATGEKAGFIQRELMLAPATQGPNPPFYYGRVGSDSNPFLLDKATYSKIATELLEKQ